MLRVTAFALIALGFARLAEAQKPLIQWDTGYDFSSVRTFQMQPHAESTLEQGNPFMHSRVVSAIAYHLCATGLTEVKANPDVYVTYYASTETKVRAEVDFYGVVEYEEDTLVVDIWAASSRRSIWRGTVSRVFAERPQKAEEQVVKAIEAMAKQSARLRARRAGPEANRLGP
jgi:hypothetical protein